MNIKVQLALIIIIVFLAYSNIFQNQFLIDDYSFITDWEQIGDLKNIPSLLIGDVPEVHKGVYRPIRSVFYAVYYSLWGVNPLGWHFHSILVHLISTVLVYFLIEKILNRQLAAFAGGLLFGLHPVHTESITYIAASMEMTGVVFFLAAFLFYLNKQRYLSYFLATLAFFTYEMTLTLPILLMLYDLTLGRSKRMFNLKKYVPYLILVAVFIFIRVVVLQISSRGDYLAYSFYHTQLTMIKVYIKYIQLLIAPFNISYLHELAPGFDSWMTKYNNLQSILNQSIFNVDILIYLLMLLGSVILAVKLLKRTPIFTFCVFWFFITLLPVSYLFPQGIALAEKYLYIASFGFVLLTGYLAAKYISKTWLLAGLMIIISIPYFYWTYQRNKDWQDEVSFWSKAALQRPQNPLPTYNLALEYGKRGDELATEKYYKKTIELEPKFWEARYNLANLYLKLGEASAAAKLYQSVLMIHPEFTPAFDRLKLIENLSNKPSK